MRINPTGPASANVMVITDYAEEGDCRRKQILSSKQGWLFEEMLKTINKKPASLYTTSICPHYFEIPTKPKKLTKPQLIKLVGENARTVEQIKEEIDLIKPNVIISMGEYSLRALTRKIGVRQFQGSVMSLHPLYDRDSVKVVPIQHPRDIFKVYDAFYYTPTYLQRAFKFENDPLPFKENTHLEIVTSFKALQNYVRAYKDSPYIVSDIETFFNLISCIGICLDPNHAIVVPLLEDTITPPELCEMLKLIQKSFEYFPFANQNAVFDQTRLERLGFRIPVVHGDTMLNMGAVYPELPKNLGFINSLHTEIPYFKDEGKGYVPSEKLYLYCAKDCLSVYKILPIQEKETVEVGTDAVVDKILMPSYPIYRDMQQRGIQVDGVVKKNLIEKYDILLKTYTGDIKESLGFDLNPFSPKQCTDLLYKYLNLPEQKKRRSDGRFTPSADEDTIEFLNLNHVQAESTKALLYKIIYTRKAKKILDYLNIALHPGDVFRTSYNLVGTESGRTSTNKSGDNWYDIDEDGVVFRKELGFALQTIPKHGFELADGTRIGDDIRTMFVPRDGYVFCEGDLSKAEAVIVTILAQDWDLLDKFYDVNLHKLTAMEVFHLNSMAEVTPDQYNKGKRARHAANYDMQEKTLAMQAMCAVIEAKAILDEFHKKNWKIRGIYHRHVREFVQRNLWLDTPYKRRRDFFVNPRSNTYLREAYSYIPQSVVGDKTKIGMIDTMEYIKEKKIDAHYLGESHDSVIAEVREGQQWDYLKELKRNMEKPIDMRKCCIPRDVDAVIKFECSLSDKNWKELKEVEV